MKGEDENGKPNGLPSSRQLAEVTGVSQRTCVNFMNETGVSNLLSGVLGDAAGELCAGRRPLREAKSQCTDSW